MHYNLRGGVNEYRLLDPLLRTVCDSEAFLLSAIGGF